MRMPNKSLDDVFKIPLYKSFAHRLPWLIIGLLGGVLAAQIVNGFEKTLKTNLYLASFIPLIVYISDAVGTQMEAFTIRDLAIQSHLKFLKYFGRQFVIVSLIGLTLAVCLFVINILLGQNQKIGLALSISLFAAVISSLLTGLLIPYAFSKTKLDPANTSGPIATIIQDLISVIVYFTIAQLFLG